MQEITDGSRIENPSLRFQIKKKKIELFLSALKIKGEKRGVLLVK